MERLAKIFGRLAYAKCRRIEKPYNIQLNCQGLGRCMVSRCLVNRQSSPINPDQLACICMYASRGCTSPVKYMSCPPQPGPCICAAWKSNQWWLWRSVALYMKQFVWRTSADADYSCLFQRLWDVGFMSRHFACKRGAWSKRMREGCSCWLSTYILDTYASPWCSDFRISQPQSTPSGRKASIRQVTLSPTWFH